MPSLFRTPLILSVQEKTQLESLQRQRTVSQCAVERARILLMAAENNTVADIAATLGLCVNTVYKWIRRFTQTSASNNSGDSSSSDEIPPMLPRLADAPRSGRPETFTPEQICAITALACEKPEDHGLPITHWTARELRDQALRQGIVPSISVRQINRLLEQTDLQPHRSRYWLNAKPDPQKEETIRAVCQVYQQAQDAASREEFTFSLDEMTGIQALERIAPDQPMKPGQPVRCEFEYRRHGTLSLLAGLDVAKGEIQALCLPTRTETDFVEMVDQLVQSRPGAKKLTLVMDNLNTHKSESLVRYVARDNGIDESLLGIKGKEGILQNLASRACFLCNPAHRIRFCYTPKHTSWMNQIEIWFGILARKVIRRGNFTSQADLKHKLEAFIDYFNRTMAKPFKWTYQGKPLQGLATT